MEQKAEKIKKLVLMLFISFAAIFTANLVAVDSTEAIMACEDDECEQGWIWDSCIDNAGGGTACSFTGDECSTSACGSLPSESG